MQEAEEAEAANSQRAQWNLHLDRASRMNAMKALVERQGRELKRQKREIEALKLRLNSAEANQSTALEVASASQIRYLHERNAEAAMAEMEAHDETEETEEVPK